ncbi:MAG: 30S ribosomal protein S16 [Candidatus Nealsonbacteria bacterium]|nr:30S ribosomal protein S16 [Candidatus Nealsonbacteria bacterium]
MKKLGRRHRPFYRICAVDSRTPRDGRVLEELGTYDPMVPETDARAVLNGERINYWLSVGAQPSDKVGVLIKKYGAEGTHVEQQQAALARLAQVRQKPAMPEPAAEQEASETETPAAETPETGTPETGTPETGTPETSEAPAEQPADDTPAIDTPTEGTGD